MRSFYAKSGAGTDHREYYTPNAPALLNQETGSRIVALASVILGYVIVREYGICMGVKGL